MKLSMSIILLVLFGKMLPCLGETPEWLIQRIDCPKLFSGMADRHMRLDASSLPHVAYGKDHLYYAWFDGSSWDHETVDPGDRVGKAASLALDDNDDAHISYADGREGKLKYAYNTGDGWILEIVDKTVGYTTSIVLTAEEAPCISYYDPGNHDLKYAHKEGGGWILETVDAKGEVGIGSSLGLDSLDNPHISYGDYEDRRLLYAFNDGSGWTIEIADSDVDFSFQSSLALGTDGSIHICYADWTLCLLKYAWRVGPGDPWRTETICSVSEETQFFSLVLDASGIPYVAYSYAGDLNLAFKNETGWQCEVLYEEGYGGTYPSLVLEENGSLHTTFYEGGIDCDGRYTIITRPR